MAPVGSPGPEPRIETRVYSAEDAAALDAALRALRAGRVVVFPTDTVYGIGGDPWSTEAVKRLYWAKQRPRDMAIPILVSAPRHVRQVAMELPEAFGRLTARFWPGGLTLVVPRRPSLPDVVCAGGASVAVRMPDHPVALALIEAAGGALAVSSANRSGSPAAVTAVEALADLEGRVAVVIDGGECPGGIASAVVDLVGRPPRLLRAGGIGLEALREIVPDLVERP